MVGVNSYKEVTESIGSLIAVFVLTRKISAVVTVLKNGTHKLNEHSKAVALISAAFFASAAESTESSLAASHSLKSVGRSALVSLTVNAHERARRSVFSYTSVVLQLTILVGGRSRVKVEVEFLVGRNAEREGVSSESALNAKGRSNGGTSVSSRHTHTACGGCHRGIVACDTVVAGITNYNHTHTVLFSLFDSHTHRLVADDLTHTVVTVNDSGRLGLFDYLKIGDGVLDTCFDAVEVNGLEAIAAVGLDTALIRLKKNVGADLRVCSRYAVAYEGIDYEICDCFPINYVCFWHNFALLKKFLTVTKEKGRTKIWNSRPIPISVSKSLRSIYLLFDYSIRIRVCQGIFENLLK